MTQNGQSLGKLTRREFLSFSALTLAALATGCGFNAMNIAPDFALHCMTLEN